MQFGLLVAGTLLVGWECWRQVRQGRELAEVEAQVRAGEQELESLLKGSPATSGSWP
jgi:hypothetical protein